jgi:hypothetical protein
MTIISRLLFWVGILCVAVFFYPSMRHEDIPNGRKDRLTFGLPASPWFDRKVKVIKEQGVEPGGVQLIHEVHDITTNVYSWSTAFPLLGISMIVAGRHFKRTKL